MHAPAPLRVFLSYVHGLAEQRARVRALIQRLQAQGLVVIADCDREAPTEGFGSWVEKEVAAADAVLVLVDKTYAAVFGTMQLRWPGPVLTPALYRAQAALRLIVPVGFDEADAAHRPGELAHQTFYPVASEQDVGLLMRTLRGIPQLADAATPSPDEQALPRVCSPLPPLEHYLTRIQARVQFHRRAWRYFCSKLESTGIFLEETARDANGTQTLTGPGIDLSLTQHSEHAEAQLEILPGTATVYASLLGLVAGARQPLECTYLVFLLHPEWQLFHGLDLGEKLAQTDIKSPGQQALVLHGWRFVIPSLSLPATPGTSIKIVPRPVYPWPLNPLRLLLHLLEKTDALHRAAIQP